MSSNPDEESARLLTKGAVTAPPHPRESERLARLRDYEILDTAPEAAFDDLIVLASHITGTPLGAISFVDRDRQWFKATRGFDKKQNDRSIAFCAHAILESGPAFVVPDATQDDRFSGNPLVTGAPHIRFYAGIPMLTPDGLPLGSFCVMDRTPRELTPEQIEMLGHLARIAMDIVESERHVAILEKHLVLGPAAGGVLPEAISAMATTQGPLHGLIGHLIGLYAPLLHGVHVRVHRFRGTFPLEAFYLPEDPPSETHQNLWQAFDRALNPTAQTLRRGTIEAGGSRYFYGLVPVAFAGRALARVDFISTVREDPCFESLFKLMLTEFLSMAEREVHATELRYQINHDPLTGLGNRTPLVAEVDQSIRNADPTHPSQALVHLRLGGLVEINDNFGHAEGDRVLVEIAGRLARLQQGKNYVARLSGAQFFVLIRGIDSVNSLHHLLAEMAALLEEPCPVDGETISLRVNIGCALIDDPSLHPIEIFRRADIAMRKAADDVTRRDPRIVIYDTDMSQDYQKDHQTNLLVRQAYRENSLFLVFQPVVDLKHGCLAGAETLLRLRQRDGRIVAASDFMGAIKRIHYQALIDEWVFAEFIRLCRDGGRARQMLDTPGFFLGLNATPALLSIPGFADRWCGQLASAGIPLSSIVVEVIEDPLLFATPAILDNLKQWHAAGIRIAVDDFGSGYSNLRHLTKLPIDIVKLDRTFLAELEAPPHRGRAVIASIIHLCRDLGYRPHVEGVETAMQDAFLRDTECRYAQGYFYGQPMPPEELLTLLASAPPRPGASLPPP